MVIETRLEQLKSWLLKCKYPKNIIDKGFHNARLQGPAQQKVNKDNITTFTHPHMSNLDFKSIINTASSMLKSAKSDNIRNLFENIKIIEGIQQPKNIWKLITNTHFRDSHNSTIRNSKPGIYAECLDPRCRICSLGYKKECSSFMTANNISWEIKSHINCNSKHTHNV